MPIGRDETLIRGIEMRGTVLILTIISLLYATEDTITDSTTLPTESVVEEVSQAKDTSLQEIDLTTWNHPVKTLLTKKNITITRVVLKNKVYPLFYISSLSQRLTPQKQGEVLQLFADIFTANGYWSYTLIDSESGDKAVIEGDREKKAIKTFLINDDPAFFDNLKKKQRETIHKAVLLTDPKLKEHHIHLTEDIDGDNSPEVVTLVSDRVFLYSWSGTLKQIGELDPSLAVMYAVDSVRTVIIDESKDEKSILLYLRHTGSGALGYGLFSFDGKKSDVIWVNFPSTSGSGNRTLADMDDDNILEDVTTFELMGKQHRIIAMYQEIGTNDDNYITTSGYGPKGFVHPKTAEDLILSYLEAVSLTVHNNCDYATEISELSTKNMKYDEKNPLFSYLHPNAIASYTPSLTLKENFRNGNEILYTFRLSLDTENKSYYCSVVKDGDALKIDSIE